MASDVLLVENFPKLVKITAQCFAHSRDVSRRRIILSLETIGEDFDVAHQPADDLMLFDDSAPVKDKEQLYHCGKHVEKVGQSIDVGVPCVPPQNLTLMAICELVNRSFDTQQLLVELL